MAGAPYSSGPPGTAAASSPAATAVSSSGATSPAGPSARRWLIAHGEQGSGNIGGPSGIESA